MKAIFLLKENKKTLARHIVKLPEVHEENFSKDVKSLTKFENAEKERVFKHKSIPQEKIAIMYHYEEWSEEQEAIRDRMVNIKGLKDFKHEWDDTPVFEHEDIKDFYNAIGYDIKKKKYIDQNL